MLSHLNLISEASHLNLRTDNLTCDDDFDGVMDPSLSIACHAGVIREVAVPNQKYYNFLFLKF